MKKLPPSDTSPEAQAVLIDIYRRMSPADKWRQLADLYQRARVLHETGYRLRHPDASEREIADDWLVRTLGPDLSNAVKEARLGLER